jgi:hypothetical protein
MEILYGKLPYLSWGHGGRFAERWSGVARRNAVQGEYHSRRAGAAAFVNPDPTRLVWTHAAVLACSRESQVAPVRGPDLLIDDSVR